MDAKEIIKLKPELEMPIVAAVVRQKLKEWLETPDPSLTGRGMPLQGLHTDLNPHITILETAEMIASQAYQELDVDVTGQDVLLIWLTDELVDKVREETLAPYFK